MKNGILAIIMSFFGCSGSLFADIQVVVGNVEVLVGSATAEVSVFVGGADPVTDMDGRFQVGDGGPAFGGTNGPQITAISYENTVWTNAPDGFVYFFPSSAPTDQIVDPNVSLNAAGESVVPEGLRMTVTLDIAGFPPGEYRLSTSETVGGATRFFNGATEIAVTYTPGTLTILDERALWRSTHFPSRYPFLAFQDDFWGDDADPDQDGVPNCFEYAFGTDPNSESNVLASAVAPGLPKLVYSNVGGTPVFEMHFCARDSEVGFSYDLQIASELTGIWTEQNAQFVDAVAPTAIGTSGFTLHQKRYTGAIVAREFFRVWLNK